MCKLLISLMFAGGVLAGCELYHEDGQDAVDAQVPLSHAPSNDVTPSEVGEILLERLPQDACTTAGVACVAGWCPVVDPTTPLGCRCVRCGAACGNGITEASEACDDGNLLDGDGCSSLQTISLCARSPAPARRNALHSVRH